MARITTDACERARCSKSFASLRACTSNSSRKSNSVEVFRCNTISLKPWVETFPP